MGPFDKRVSYIFPFPIFSTMIKELMIAVEKKVPYEKCEKCDRTGIPNRILSGLMYWLIVAIVMGILFIITGLLIVGIGYQVGKIYRKYCWDILRIIVAITSTAIVIYFGEWIKNAIPINLMVFLLLSHVIYIGIRCYVKGWMEERGYF